MEASHELGFLEKNRKCRPPLHHPPCPGPRHQTVTGWAQALTSEGEAVGDMVPARADFLDPGSGERLAPGSTECTLASQDSPILLEENPSLRQLCGFSEGPVPVIRVSPGQTRDTVAVPSRGFPRPGARIDSHTTSVNIPKPPSVLCAHFSPALCKGPGAASLLDSKLT